MEIAEFERCINLGLGRAILHLQKHSSKPYREAIIYACLHNTIYDRQVEGGKGEYIFEIIRLSGEEAFYRQKIIEALKTAEIKAYNRDTSHLLELVGSFAKKGDEEARQIIYDLFDANIDTDEFGFHSRIIDISALDGFIYVIEKLMEFVPEDENLQTDYLLFCLEDISDLETLGQQLEEIRKTNQALDTYLKTVEAYRSPQRKQSRPKKRQVDEANLLEAAIALEQETDSLLLKKYLMMFRKTAFPRPPEPLFRLTKHENFQIVAMSFGALEQVQSPLVRDFALDLIVKEQNIGRAIGLLERNFEESDWEMIQAATEKKLDAFDYHSIQFAVRDVFEANPSPKAAKSLLNLYEYGVCSFCRRYILELLVYLDALPESILEECFHDSNDDIREWAKKGFPPESYKSLPKR